MKTLLNYSLLTVLAFTMTFTNWSFDFLPDINVAYAADTCAAQPTVNASFPASANIGESVTGSLTFTNPAGGSDGYGPFIDMILSAGADGDDGFDFSSAAYLGSAITPVIINAPAGGGDVDHPFAVDNTDTPLVITLAEDESLIVFELPFGSFVQNQSAIVLDVTLAISSNADAGTALGINARGGFRYGCDGQDNPTTDPSDTGVYVTSSITPTVFSINKTFSNTNGEAEVVSGPNYSRNYAITVDIANGQDINDLVITDVFPENLFLDSVTSLTPAGSNDTSTHPGGISSAPNNIVEADFGAPANTTVTGSASTNDVQMVLDFYAPEILDVNTGAPESISNDARASGEWDPQDPNDNPATIISDDTPNDVSFTVKSLAIQKRNTISAPNDNGGSGPTPDDIVTFTIEGQISDYFAFDTIVIDDILSDGLRYDITSDPELVLDYNGTSNTYTMSSYVIDPVAVDGTQSIEFDISGELALATRLNSSQLLGACIPDGGTGGSAIDCDLDNDGATTFTLTYDAIIQDEFDASGGDASIDIGDRLRNDADISGRILNNNDLTPRSDIVNDNTSSTLQITGSSLTKDIAYINGCDQDGNLFGGGVCTFPDMISPGDIVTYSIGYNLPSTDFETLEIFDYLPLPVFQAASVNATPGASFSNPISVTGVLVEYGPNDTYFSTFNQHPTITAQSGNRINANYGTFDDNQNRDTNIELLLSVEVSNEPFADGLNLTNQAGASSGSTNGGAQASSTIKQITLGQPNLVMTKGVVATDNTESSFSPATVAPVAPSVPGSSCARFGSFGSNDLSTSPINSDILDINGGDIVTFAITLENSGASNAGVFDVQLSDIVPTGFIDPGVGNYNLCVQKGDGTVLGAGSDYSGDLFNTTLELADNGNDGAIPSPNEAAPNNGENIIIVSYDLEVDSAAVIPAGAITNTATLSNFASTEGGPDFTTEDQTDNAVATAETFSIDKTVIGTSDVNSTPETTDSGTPNVVVGERVNYRAIVTVPEESRMENVVWTDTLPSGMALYDNNGSLGDLVSVSASAGITADGSSDFSGFEPDAALLTSSNGRTIEIDFGTLVNNDTDNTSDESIIFIFSAVVLDQNPPVDRNRDLTNNVSLSWDDGMSGSFSSSDATAPTVNVTEPNFIVSKTAPAVNSDSERTVQYQIDFRHDNNANRAHAYDVRLLDDSFEGITIQSVNEPFTISNLNINARGACSAVDTIGAGLSNNTSDADTTIDLVWDEIPLDCRGGANTLRVTYDVTLDSGVTGDITNFINDADITYSSQPTATNNQSSFVPVGESDERNYSDNDDHDIAWLFSVGAETCLWDNDNSQCFADGYDVVVGDTIQYRSRIEIPEDTNFDNLLLSETLDNGLVLVSFDDINAPADVTNSSAGGFVNLATANGSSLGSAGQNTGDSEVDVNANAESFTLDFGDVVHADNNDNQDAYITVFYTVAIANNAGAIRAADLNNMISATWDSGNPASGEANAAADTVRVDESELMIEKTVTTSANTNERTTEYRIEVNHSAVSVADGAVAFDVTLLDDSLSIAPNNPLNGAGGTNVNPAWVISNIIVTNNGVCSAPAPTNDTSDSDVLDLTWSSVPVNCDDSNPIVVTFDATLNSNVSSNQIIQNSAGVLWTSQAGDQTTSSSSYSALDVERTGNSSGVGGTENDYRDEDSVTTSYSFGSGIAKSITDSSNSVTALTEPSIGEIITYRIDVTIPADSFVEDFDVVDTLPTGLALYNDTTDSYNHSSGLFNITSSDPTLTASVGITAPSLAPASPTNGFTLSYYSTVNPSPTGAVVRNTSSSDQILSIEYKTVVQNVGTNVGLSGSRTTLDNGAESSALGPIPDDPRTGLNESNPTNRVTNMLGTIPRLTLSEPDLQITKTVKTQPAGNNDRSISYEFEVCHTANSTGSAFDISILDDLAELNYDPASVSISVSAGMAPTVVDTSDVSEINLSYSEIPAGFACGTNPIVISFNAELDGSISSDTNLDNTVELDWNSLPEAEDIANQDRGDAANEYNDNSTATGTFTFDIGTFSKSAFGDGSESSTLLGNAVVGELLDYRISIPVPGNTFFDDFVLTDTLDPGLAFVEFTNITVSSNDVTSNDGAGTPVAVIDLNDTSALNTRAQSGTDTNISISNNGRDIEIDFDRLENDNATDQALTLEYQVLVTNVAATTSGTGLSNDAEIRWNDKNPNTGVDVAQSKTASATDQVLREPTLSTTKRVTPFAPPQIGNDRIISYQIDITHTGDSATAHDIIVTEDLTSIIDPNPAPAPGATGFMDYYVDYVPGTLVATLPTGTTQGVLTEDVDGFEINFDQLAFGETISFTFDTLVEDTTIAPNGTVIDNNVETTWTSLQGEPTLDQSQYSSDDDTYIERSSNTALSAENDYAGLGNSQIIMGYVDLMLEQTVSNENPGNGEEVTFTLILTNEGGGDATNVEVTNEVTAGSITILNAIPSQGTFDSVSGIWNIGTVLDGEVITLEFTATIDEFGENINTAFISAVDQADRDSLANNGVIGEDDQTSITLDVPNPSRSAGRRRSPEVINSIFGNDSLEDNSNSEDNNFLKNLLERLKGLLAKQAIEKNNEENLDSRPDRPIYYADGSCAYFTQHMRKGDRDGRIGREKQEIDVPLVIEEIAWLQTVLNDQGFNAGPVDGIFGSQTESAVNAWQVQHFDAVLAPWNLSGPTGRFYQSSERWMNEILGCPDTVTLDNGKFLDFRSL